MKLQKVFYKISWLAIFCVGVLIVLTSYWMIKPYNPIVFNERPFKVLTPEVRSGDFVVFQIDYCKLNELTPTISRYSIDGLIYATPDILAVKKEAGCSRVDNSVYVCHTVSLIIYFAMLADIFESVVAILVSIDPAVL